MSKERARAREARIAQRQAELAEAARRREAEERRAARRSRLSVSLPRRKKRYGALPTRVVLQILAGWLLLQALFWWVFPSLGVRACLAVLSSATLLVLVRTRKRPAR